MGQATIAAEAVEHSLRWVISVFDNGKPELEVTTYSNGWIRCPELWLAVRDVRPWSVPGGEVHRVSSEITSD